MQQNVAYRISVLLAATVLVVVGGGLYGCLFFDGSAVEVAGDAYLESAPAIESLAAEPAVEPTSLRPASPADAGPVTRRPMVGSHAPEAAVDAANAPDAAPDAAADAAAVAIEKALPFLEQEGVDWMAGRVWVQDGASCVSCHHVPYAIWSHDEAKRAGIRVGEGMEALVARAVEFSSREDKARSMIGAPLLLGGATPSEVLARRLLEHQERAGHFRARGQFPSQRRALTETDAVATAWVLLAMDADPVTRGAADARQEALEWLEARGLGVDGGESSEWVAVRLVLAQHLGEDVAAGRERLLSLQNPDGGWPWAEGEPSNAFSTGQALYALAIAHDGAAAAARDGLERGRRYLVDNQGAEGYWLFESRLVSEEPSEAMELIYRYWGTAWAVIGLARSLEPRTEPGQIDLTG